MVDLRSQKLMFKTAGIQFFITFFLFWTLSIENICLFL